MSIKAVIQFEKTFRINGEQIAYEIWVAKKISDATAIFLMHDDLLNLEGTCCSDLEKPNILINLDDDETEIWMRNDVINEDDVAFKTDSEFVTWLNGYAFCKGWKLDSVDEQDPTDVFVDRFKLHDYLWKEQA